VTPTPHEHDDFAVEPPGLPAPLPEGEQMLWQGKPGWMAMAIRAFHVRLVAIYFAALMVWRFASARSQGMTLAEALGYSAWLLPMALLTMALLFALAWGYARTTVYTITTKRVMIKSGIAVQISLNLPFKRIDGAAVKMGSDGHGDVVMRLNPADRVPILVLWPSMRPAYFRRPQPMFRGIPDAGRAADILAAALTGAPIPAAPRVAEEASPAPGGAPVPAAG
jgi:hypothetical protein